MRAQTPKTCLPKNRPLNCLLSQRTQFLFIPRPFCMQCYGTERQVAGFLKGHCQVDRTEHKYMPIYTYLHKFKSLHKFTHHQINRRPRTVGSIFHYRGKRQVKELSYLKQALHPFFTTELAALFVRRNSFSFLYQPPECSQHSGASAILLWKGNRASMCRDEHPLPACFRAPPPSVELEWGD